MLDKNSTKKKILIVDDSSVFITALMSTLAVNDYEIQSAGEAQGALHIFRIFEPDLVLSDIQMPGMSGIEFLREIKKIKMNIPVVLMTGFSELTDIIEAAKHYADGFLAKPFKREELMSLIQKLTQDPLKREHLVSSDDLYTKLPIEDFISGSDIKYPIYIRLNQNRYVKIAHAGENIPVEKIQIYKQKNVFHLYLEKEDFSKYLGFTLTLNRAVSKSKQIDTEKKLKILKITGNILLSNIFLEGVDDKNYGQSKEVVENMLDTVSDHQDALSLLEILNQHTDYLYTHSLAVSVYTTMLARALGWVSTLSCSKAAMAGLLHDVGKKEIERKILDTPRAKMSYEEIQRLETHPSRGAEILATIPGMGEEVIQAVLQHHENCMGSGYPRRTPRNRISPLAKMISVVNEFCLLTIKNPNSKGMQAKDAFDSLKLLKAGELDHEYFNVFQSIFKSTQQSKKD